MSKIDKAERLAQDGFSANVEPILFYKPSDDYGCFSNFSTHEIYLTDPWTGNLRRYKTGEHRFQAMKATGPTAHDYVCSAPTASEAKFRGSYKGGMELRKCWVSDHNHLPWFIMLEICIAKVLRHNDIWEDLEATEDLPIYEDSPVDDIWGWRFYGDYRGKNLLGRAWMETRSIVFAEGF